MTSRTAISNPIAAPRGGLRGCSTLAVAVALALGGISGGAGADPSKIDPAVVSRAKSGAPVPVLLLLREQAKAQPEAPANASFEAKVDAAVRRYQALAAASQAALRAELDRRGIRYQAFWLVNAIAIEADYPTLADLSWRPDVAEIEPDFAARHALPQVDATAPEGDHAKAVEWGIANVRAPEVWARGATGQGVVVAGQDTGYAWQHPALRNAYRGWNGATADHDYNWRDAIHVDNPASGGTNRCGFDSPVPCDDGSHGTHTMGTIVGLDGANEIGVAPGAKWIGCRNMENGWGTPATYIECFEFFVAPTTVAGASPDPSRAPHVINNSWGCPPDEGCAANSMNTAVANTVAAGIFVVVSAGNGGPACATIVDPPATHAAAFTIASHTSSNAISSFSSRGPAGFDPGTGALVIAKPDLSAPGSGVRSSVPPAGYGSFSGTSMAGPHVAGVAALVMGARAELKGRPAAVARLLIETAVPTTSTQDCGAPFAAGGVPNATFGHGRVNAFAAWDRLTADGFD